MIEKKKKINMWYQRLDERYNFSLGPNILPLMTTKDLSELEGLDPPFLRHFNGIGDGPQSNVSPIVGRLIDNLQLLTFFIFRKG